MAAGGCTYQQIADEFGYANRGTVHRRVREALEAEQVESIDLLRTVEMQRIVPCRPARGRLRSQVTSRRHRLRISVARSRVLGLGASMR